MIDYYYLEEDPKATRTIKTNNSVKQVHNKTISHLDLIFKFTYVSDLKLIVGMCEVSKNKYRFEIIDVLTGLTLKPCRRASIAINRVLNLDHGDFIVECTPIDPILFEYIRNKQQRILNSKKASRRGEYD